MNPPRKSPREVLKDGHLGRIGMMDAKTKKVKKITEQESQLLKNNVKEIRRLIYGTGEKDEVADKLRGVFLMADKWKVPPAELTDLLDEIFDMYPMPKPHQNEEYLSLLRLSMAKKALDHSWIKDYYRSFKPNALTDFTIKLLENGEYELVLDLLEKFHENVFKVDGFIDILKVKKLHEDFMEDLRKKIPEIDNIEKCLGDQNIYRKVATTFNATYDKGKGLWPTILGKNRVRINIEAYRPESQRYVITLKNDYPVIYRSLYTQESFFYMSMSPESRDLEAMPRIICMFIAAEAFLKENIKLPPSYSPKKKKPTLADYVKYLEKHQKTLTENWKKYYWDSPYIHKNAIPDKGRKYSLHEGLLQYADWRSGNIQTTLSYWDFAQHVVHPFTYELLCDLMDAFGIVKGD
ncbi:MAG: hypothetical protein JSW28_10090 [Thermoplasmata archaeon]|nr:MAG: hypothetical protein JSW28_10090 [Thermoplasmata archaeon]